MGVDRTWHRTRTSRCVSGSKAIHGAPFAPGRQRGDCGSPPSFVSSSRRGEHRLISSSSSSSSSRTDRSVVGVSSSNRVRLRPGETFAGLKSPFQAATLRCGFSRGERSPATRASADQLAPGHHRLGSWPSVAAGLGLRPSANSRWRGEAALRSAAASRPWVP